MQLPDNIANERKIKKKHKNIPKPDEIKPVNKCYGYIRVSTNQQKDEGLSLENQKRRIEGWAMMSEYELVNIFADEGVSGKTVEKRKALKQLLSTIKPGEALVTLAFSRLSRSARDFLNIIYDLSAMGCRIVVIKEGLDTTTPHGRFAALMFIGVAQLESELISDRINDSMAIKKERGEFIGRVPYGWRLSNGAKSDLIEFPEEQIVINRIKTLRNTIDPSGKQMSYEKIANKLTEEGIKPPGRSKKWEHKAVSRIYNREEVKTKGRDPNYDYKQARKAKQKPEESK